MLLSENLISESDLLVVRDTKGSLEISTPNTKKPWNKNKLKKKKSNSRHTKITENGNTDWLSWWTILVIFLMFCASNTVHKKDYIKQTEMSVIHLIFILFNYFYSLGIRHWAWAMEVLKKLRLKPHCHGTHEEYQCRDFYVRRGRTGKCTHQNSQLTQMHLAEGSPHSCPSWPLLLRQCHIFKYTIYQVNTKVGAV